MGRVVVLVIGVWRRVTFGYRILMSRIERIAHSGSYLGRTRREVGFGRTAEKVL